MRNYYPKVVVSSRIGENIKSQIKHSGHTTADAIYYFARQLNDPVGSLEIDLYFLNETLREKKLDLIELETQISLVEDKLDKAKENSDKYYPEVYLKGIAKKFIKKYEEDKLNAYEGKSIDEAINIARKGLVNEVSQYGFTYKDIKNEILDLYNRSKL